MTQIEQILCNFDFVRVKKTMDALRWEWHGEGVPSIAIIKCLACDIMTIAEAEKTSIAEGGFKARYDEGTLTLEFIVEEYTGDAK